MAKSVSILTRDACADISAVLLEYKSLGLNAAELAEAIILAMSEAGIPRHELSEAYDRLGL